MADDRYPPGREADLITATQTFHDVANVAPTTYSLTAAQLTTLATKLADFQTKWDVCQVPGTKTKVAVQQKNASKADLVFYLRSLVRVTQNALTTTNAIRAAVGIPLRPETVGPIPVPGEPPVFEVLKVYGHQITCRLHALTGDGRGIPEGCIGAQIFAFYGDTPSTDPDAWIGQGVVTRAKFVVEIPGSVAAGSRVYLTAAWMNPRGQTGQACSPVLTGVGFEGVETAAG